MIGVPAELSDTIDSTFGAAAPLVTLGLVVAANNARRAAEQRAAAAAADAASAAAKAAVEDTQRAVEEISAQQWGKLLLCLLIDIGGDSSFLLPGLGEATDAIYAPLEALSLNALYGSGVVASLGFVEEALPFSDALPTATLVWTLENVFPDSKPAEWLGVGREASAKRKSSKGEDKD